MSDNDNSRVSRPGRPLPSWPPAARASIRSTPVHLSRTSALQGDPAERGRLRRAFLPAFIFTLLLWWLHFLAGVLGWNAWAFGIRPGELAGLVGILFAPLIHGDWEHLVANTPAVLILGTLLFYSYPRAARWVIPLVWLGSGAGVWLFGQDGSVHAGASGLTHGLMFFLFIVGVLRREPRAMAIAMAVFFLYGGMVLTIFPREEGISWEAHLFGAIPGALLAFLLFRLDAMPPRKVYSWEQETEEEAEDPVIGDQWKRRRAPPPEHLEDTDEVPLHGDDEEERW